MSSGSTGSIASVNRCSAAPRTDGGGSWDIPSKIGSMALRRNGGAVLRCKPAFTFLTLRPAKRALIHDPEAHLPGTRLNDGKVDRQGRFIAGSMDMNEAGANGALYRLDPDMSVHVLETGIICSNGPCWSPDGATFYFTDTWSEEISAYDYDTVSGTPTNKRRFASFKEIGGAPDGATVDAEGFIWSAAVYSGQIVRFAPDGSIDRIIKTPVLKATSVAFGGTDLDVLFVTSMARPPLPRFPEDGPMAGHLFAIHGLGIRGLPEQRFAG